MKLISMMLLLLIPFTATASSDRPKIEQEQSNEAIAAFVNDTAASAIAPSGNGPCWGSLAFQNTVFGISFGRARKDCAEQSLAILLRQFGEAEKGKQILLWQFYRVAKRYEPQRVCLLPLDEHCPATTYETDR